MLTAREEGRVRREREEKGEREERDRVTVGKRGAEKYKNTPFSELEHGGVDWGL